MKRTLFFVLIIFVYSSCKMHPERSRPIIDLSGYWQFDIDPSDSGTKKQWFLKELSDSILLPGTMDLNHKGNENKEIATNHLSRLFTYTGAAWYRKNIIIPQEWQDQRIQLEMERTKPSKVWIDNEYVGESQILESSQKYDLSGFLSPGKHTITVRIDNRSGLTPYGYTHLLTDHTQTNWNGIIGKLRLESSPKTYISDLQVYPDIDARKVRVMLSVDNQLNIAKVDIELEIEKEEDQKKTKLKPANYSVTCDSIVKLEYDLGNETALWDEYHQPVYLLNVKLSNNHKLLDSREVTFGMRKFAARETNFTINNRVTFLRGKHDACVFPLTGCPPMDTEGWMYVFRIAKSYGINHYRFHTWCPPEAAFEAADKLGIYLQPELPFWNIKSDTLRLMKMFMEEGTALLKSYGNHPSFVMFSMGNEISGDQKKIEKLIDQFKKIDSRPLYTQGSNNNIGYTDPTANADYHTTARMPYTKNGQHLRNNVENPAISFPFAYDTILTHVRLSHAFVDSNGGGILNSCPPSTMFNYNHAVSLVKVPIIGHEVGQYQIYPDYGEIKKYTGILKPRNLEFFRDKLEQAGMMDQNRDFAKASGALAAICYRAEIETALRTKGFGGFQLLDLQDFPGQGTALIGILDAFMDSKNVISREEWLQSCNDVVPLLLFDKFCWTSDETFRAIIKVANYSEKNITQDLDWEIKDTKGTIVEKGTIGKAKIALGGLQDIGKIEYSLKSIKTPDKLTIRLSINNTSYENSYPIWVYPVQDKPIQNRDVIVTKSLDRKVMSSLNDGVKVLYFPEANSVKQNSVGGMFIPDFWNFGMFKGISERLKKPVSPGTLGILTNPKHPLFQDFPTDFHTNWQWWTILKNSHPLILNKTTKYYRPIVQVIDNLERSYKLGLIFEFKVGKGKLLICMSDLTRLNNYPEAVQLYKSILSYMKSDSFNPKEPVTVDFLNEIIK